MNTKIYFTVVLCFLSLWSNAQEISDNSNNYQIIKYSPMSLMNVHFPAIQFAYEHQIGERSAMQYELGGIYLPKFILAPRGLGVHRTLVEYRWYKEPFHNGSNKYQGFGLRFQKQYQHDVEFRKLNSLLRLTKSHTATGFYYTRGIQDKIRNTTIEVGAALGVQYYDVSVLNIIEGTDELTYKESVLFTFDPGGLIVPMGFLVLKIGYDWDKIASKARNKK